MNILFWQWTKWVLLNSKSLFVRILLEMPSSLMVVRMACVGSRDWKISVHVCVYASVIIGTSPVDYYIIASICDSADFSFRNLRRENAFLKRPHHFDTFIEMLRKDDRWRRAKWALRVRHYHFRISKWAPRKTFSHKKFAGKIHRIILKISKSKLAQRVRAFAIFVQW